MTIKRKVLFLMLDIYSNLLGHLNLTESSCFLLLQECNGHRVSASVPRVLVGNKCDLVDQIQVSRLKQSRQPRAEGENGKNN